MAEANVLTYPAVTAATELESWRLEYVNATTVQLGRLGGTGTSQRGMITIDGATYTFAAAPTGSNGGIGADTSVYVYVRDVSGTLTFSFESTAPTVQVPGAYAVKTGDAARRYVGKLRTDGSGQFTEGAVWSANKHFYRTRQLVNDLRLSCQSADPAPSGNQTAVGTLYLTFYNGNRISLYNSLSLEWEDLYLQTPLAISVGGLTVNSNYDVFAFSDSGRIRAETLIWTNSTTRATAIVWPNGSGVESKSGDMTRRYVGTFRTTSAVGGETEDSTSNRYVWNRYNQVRRRMIAQDSGSHTYNVADWRIWDGASPTAGTNLINFVLGQAQSVRCSGGCQIQCGTAGLVYICGVGLNTTASNTGQYYRQSAATNLIGGYVDNELSCAIGLNTVNLVEFGNASAGTFSRGAIDGVVMG